MRMMLARWKEVLIGAAMIVGAAAPAYDTDIHFYVLYTVFRDSGFTADEAKELATLDEYIDWHKKTEPSLNPFEREQRRTYHFPSGASYDCPNTERNSPFAKHNVNRAFQQNDSTWLGMAMHVYMDSYSHETYGPLIGHALAGHNPDRPHLMPGKLRELARMAYNIADHYREIKKLTPVTHSISIDQYEKWAEFQPPSYYWWLPRLVMFDYMGTEVAERVAEWQKNIKNNFGDDVAYAAPDKTLLAKFEAVVAKYSLPGKKGDCIGTEWSDPSKQSSGTAAAWASSPKRQLGVADIDKIVARLRKMKLEQAVKYIAIHPEIITDSRVQALVTSDKGLDCLLKIAGKKAEPYAILSVISQCDWSNVDFVGTTAANLSSDKLRTSLLAAGLLSNFPLEEATKQIGAVYQKVNVEKLSASDRQYLLNMLPSDTYVISQYAPEVNTIVGKLLDDKKLALQTAALSYKIGADFANANVTSDAAIVAAINASRQTALELLRKGSAAKLKNDEAVKFWITRSFEDFDATAKDSESDRANLANLAVILENAVENDDLTQLRAAATALSTYDPEDKPAQELIDLLKDAVVKNTDADVAVDLGYALEQMTGLSFSLTPSGLANFENQWREKRGIK